MAVLTQELKRRRILPAVGLYAGGCWALVEVIDWLVKRYLLSPSFTEVAFWGLLSFIPAVILISWTHGRPGKDRHTLVEKVGVLANLAFTIGLLLLVFGDRTFGAIASEVTILNEEGIQETHYIPSAEFRRRIAVFFFENQSGDPEVDWLQYGVTELLVQDLAQSPFVLARSPWNNWSDGFYSRMLQHGIVDGLKIPKSLMREIANDANLQYFVEGFVSKDNEEYRVTVRAWEVASFGLIAEVTESGQVLYEIIDRISVELLSVLRVPLIEGADTEDLPLAETYGKSEEAFRNYVAALNARLFENDIDASNELLDAALVEDPDFVLAWLIKSFNLIEAGDLQSSRVTLEKAQKLDYRLPARDRAKIKFLGYRISGQIEKQMAFLRLQTQLRDDASSHNILANILMIAGELEEAKKEFLAVLSIDPLSVSTYLQLSALESATQNSAVAIEYAEKYVAERPEDAQGYMALGDLLRDHGELGAARERYMQASLLGNQVVEPTLRLCDLAARQNDTILALQLLEEAERIATTPSDKLSVSQMAGYLQYRTGKLRDFIERLHEERQLYEQVSAPFEAAMSLYPPMIESYIYLGDIENAELALYEAREAIPPPLDEFLAFSSAIVLVEKGNIEGAERELGRAQDIMQQFGLEFLSAQVELVRAYILRKRGEHSASAKAFRAAQMNIERTVVARNVLFLALPGVYAELTESLVLSGDLGEAEDALKRGFKLDPAHPMLWASKAKYELSSGSPELALDAVNIALTIWNDADPEYVEFVQARELKDEIEQAL